jgi:uncharacterized protein (UPF0303 family)
MTPQELIRAIERQEQALALQGFDEATAHAIGTALREAALSIEAPVVIDVRTAHRRLYFTALPGASPDNEDWARRKGNLALRCHAASLRVGLMLDLEGRSPWPDAVLAFNEYCTHGGGFPIRVQGTGVVGCIGVSGLPSREDHELITRVLAQHLGLTGLALPA